MGVKEKMFTNARAHTHENSITTEEDGGERKKEFDFFDNIHNTDAKSSLIQDMGKERGVSGT